MCRRYVINVNYHCGGISAREEEMLLTCLERGISAGSHNTKLCLLLATLKSEGMLVNLDENIYFHGDLQWESCTALQLARSTTMCSGAGWRWLDLGLAWGLQVGERGIVGVKCLKVALLKDLREVLLASY